LVIRPSARRPGEAVRSRLSDCAAHAIADLVQTTADPCELDALLDAIVRWATDYLGQIGRAHV